MNKGLSDRLLAEFSDISLVERPVLSNQDIRDGNLLAGDPIFQLFFFVFIG